MTEQLPGSDNPYSPTSTVTSQAQAKLRKPWLAGLLAAVCHGLGHVYVGRPLLGAAIFGLPYLVWRVILSSAVLVDANLVAVLSIVVVLALCVWVGQIVWAVQLARAAGTGYRLRRVNRLVVYLGFFVVTIAISQISVLQKYVIEAFDITTASLLPTLEVGDQILVAKLGSRNTTPERGDLVVFLCPIEPHEDYIKRVVAGPGDEVVVVHGELHINGEPLERKRVERRTFWDRDGRTERWHPFDADVYRERNGRHEYSILVDADTTMAASDFGPVVVPDGHLFMMGDNRDHSFDSRAWGPVPVESVLGRAHTIWFSYGHEGLRTDRIGQRVE